MYLYYCLFRRIVTTHSAVNCQPIPLDCGHFFTGRIDTGSIDFFYGSPTQIHFWGESIGKGPIIHAKVQRIRNQLTSRKVPKCCAIFHVTVRKHFYVAFLAVASLVAGHAPVLVEDRDGGGCHAHIEFFAP